MENVTSTFEDGIATLTLNRPDSLNAMSQPMVQALRAQVEALEALPDLRAVIITGAGRAFSAGGDLLEFETLLNSGKQELLDVLRYNQDALQMVEDIPVPVIGAVNGVAVAGGLELMLCCDILLAAEEARIGDGHSRYGVIPAAGATVRLPERISPSNAARLFYSAELMPAEVLKAWGLIDEVVPPDRLMPRAMELARTIATASPEANRHIKALTAPATRYPGRAERMRAELDRFAEHLEGHDFAQGLAAFRSKVPASY